MNIKSLFCRHYWKATEIFYRGGTEKNTKKVECQKCGESKEVGIDADLR